jgi:glutathione peroxidase
MRARRLRSQAEHPFLEASSDDSDSALPSGHLELDGGWPMRTTIRNMTMLCAAICSCITGASWAQSSTCPPILNHRFNRLQDEARQDLCQYSGKVVLVVNTASYCGFTHQYKGLEALQAKYKEKGLVVLGFPSNDFGKQEPGSDKEIADFCFNTYGVKFPMFSKSSVAGSGANPLHAALIKATGTTPKWNFYKYLIDRNGNVTGSYSSLTEPDDKSLVADIEKALVQSMSAGSQRN